MAQSLTRRKLVSLFAAIVLAFSMMGFAPAAFATTDSTGSDALSAAEIGTPDRTATTITATTDDLSVAEGNTLDMSLKFTAPGLDATTQHIDYKITNVTGDNGVATINKHSGILTASSEGTVTVTAYLVNIPKPNQNHNNPCQTAAASATKQVTITSSNAYGYQGNNLMVMMTSFNPEFQSYSSSTGYLNKLTGVTASNGVISFNYSQNYGIGQNTISGYQSNNAGRIELRTLSGTMVKSLGNGISLAQQGNSKTNLIANVDASNLGSGSYVLMFLSTYVAGNGTSTLGVPVAFTFTL